MQVQITDNNVVITLPRIKQVSKSGKTLLVATSNGNRATTATVDGKQVVIGVNAYIPIN